jgi:hypothetical protein
MSRYFWFMIKIDICFKWESSMMSMTLTSSTRGKQSKLLTGQRFANVDIFRISVNSKITKLHFHKVSGNNTKYYAAGF